MFRKQNGKPNLDTIPHASQLSTRSPDEFAPGGNGGYIRPPMCIHDVPATENCHQCIEIAVENKTADFLDTKRMEEDMRPRLPKVAALLKELTYGEMFQLCHEAVTGKIGTVDPMEVDEAAKKLAAQLHNWQLLVNHTQT